MELDNAIHDKIVRLFESSGDNYWLTVDQIAGSTEIQSSEVLKTLRNSGTFVRSSYRNNNGEPMYTTRELFRNKAPFVDKMIGVFKNRID